MGRTFVFSLFCTNQLCEGIKKHGVYRKQFTEIENPSCAREKNRYNKRKAFFCLLRRIDGRGEKTMPGRIKKKDLPPLPLLVLTGCLLLGAVAGCIWMVLFQKEGTGALSLEQWAGEGRLWLFFRLLGGFLLYLLPLFCCGLFPFGAYGVLLLFGVRGFTLACWVGEFCRDYGLGGYAASPLAGSGGRAAHHPLYAGAGRKCHASGFEESAGKKGKAPPGNETPAHCSGLSSHSAALPVALSGV